ncbi:MAG: Ribosome-recycling factor [Parcubacteria group bacterium GW2011_GWC1_43_11b]|uniref:Ribosome recycling factor n=2 Tax=Candidatus Vogeliibacteriota TaxID=1817922 RepID=A0A1G2QG42_9BACT|nr:MAG: Ribosome-recycling factor [Parcubacteria group bacterium GW2011_GWB1_42_9]KKS89498.1 MAG: Ribosome-recycling factor [Parcubacteria group bacterium GW2011_GWC1_43_11b]KKT10147.1 MAG: Ribosome-recycling factor [Parcubacteria group bacterium GW2011_GWA1_43_21]OHA59019.1 MAG: ribosome recycling factor [Candidatus Vogelbacteria bacterium RIFOXYB1_FULL_42_16]OHA60350.1 MAG: ribosome recycling factor [Candidatus Vogelbacteria bacterium RIFOXYD1_FULL_42_15]
MAYNFSELKTHLADIEVWLAGEYSGVRTGKASPALLDSVLVDSYGSKLPIKHVAAIGIEDALTLRITPWDKSQVKGIESAIAAANIGVSTAPDSDGIRVIFPTLTEERRKMLTKLTNEKLEEARVSLRKEREKVWNEIQVMEKNGGIGEDVKFRLKDELQKIVDDGNTKFDSLASKKREEIEG